ncbi:MAG TPA: sulfotransferase [Aestuariivirgaceae bacterium]|nr:sulfotransferase [Aestuariivirgaceae bacterium]
MTAPLAASRDPAGEARAALRLGRLDDARSHFGLAMAQSPRDAMLLVEAAVVEGQLGDLKSAERLLEKSLKLDPGNADAWYNLGQVARESNLLERAVRLFRKALALDQRYPDAAFGLGEALYVQGKAEEALAWLDQAARLAPDDAEIVHVKALALDHLGRAGDALDAYRQVLRLQPDHVNASLNLAVLTARNADPLESLALLDRVEASPGVPPAGYAVAAQVLHYAAENERALAYVDKALGLGIHAAEVRLTRANILSDDGDFDAAEAELRKVLEIRKDDPQAHYRLAVIRRLEPKAERALLRQAQDHTASASARSAACFALYHLADQAGDYRHAFVRLAEANALQGREAAFNLPRHQQYCARIKAVYLPQLITEQRAHGFDRPGPVFIFGMPRSGTTLTEQILAAHPDVLALGERLNVQRTVTASQGWPEAAASFDAASPQEQGRQVYDSMFAAAAGRPLASDKSPGNYLLAGAIACMLPGAKLVYVRRTPGDNALSLFEQSFLRGLTYSYDLGKIGAVYREHLAVMNHWIETCGLTIHTVDYDLLVQDPESHIRRLLDFVGLDFRPECLAPHRVERNVRTSSVWQVRQPISAKSVGRWRRYEQLLEPFFRALEGA